jgi:CRP-like cAMP-binding protein
VKTLTLKKDMTVFWEGDPAASMYRILSGKVAVYKNYATIRQEKLAELTAGDFFGEMELIEGSTRFATVAVLESPTTLERIEESEFGLFLAQNPDVVQEIIRQLCHKLRTTTEAYLEICESIAQATTSATDDCNLSSDERLRSIHDKEAVAHMNA